MYRWGRALDTGGGTMYWWGRGTRYRRGHYVLVG